MYLERPGVLQLLGGVFYQHDLSHYGQSVVQVFSILTNFFLFCFLPARREEGFLKSL